MIAQCNTIRVFASFIFFYQTIYIQPALSAHLTHFTPFGCLLLSSVLY